MLGRSWASLWPLESRAAVQGSLDEARLSQGSTFEAWRPGPDCEKVWWQISVSPLRETSGELVGILTISRDVTDLVRLREGERTLALEMKHRLRNAYTVASAIVTQSARGDQVQRAFAETVTARLADVALSQTRLLEAGEKSWALPDLVRTLVEAHGEGAAGVRFTGSAEAAVYGHEAMLVALILGELTNNSLKYGALMTGKSVKVAWSTHKTGALAISWYEPLAKPLDVPLGARDLGSGYSLMARMAQPEGIVRVRSRRCGAARNRDPASSPKQQTNTRLVRSTRRRALIASPAIKAATPLLLATTTVASRPVCFAYCGGCLLSTRSRHSSYHQPARPVLVESGRSALGCAHA